MWLSVFRRCLTRLRLLLPYMNLMIVRVSFVDSLNSRLSSFDSLDYGAVREADDVYSGVKSVVADSVDVVDAFDCFVAVRADIVEACDIRCRQLYGTVGCLIYPGDMNVRYADGAVEPFVGDGLASLLERDVAAAKYTAKILLRV